MLGRLQIGRIGAARVFHVEVNPSRLGLRNKFFADRWESIEHAPCMDHYVPSCDIRLDESSLDRRNPSWVQNLCANQNSDGLCDLIQRKQAAKKYWCCFISMNSLSSIILDVHPTSCHVSMRKAIKRVASDGTLVFTAAPNYGKIWQVNFPTQMQDVLCMYYTDGRAKMSASINPAPQTSKFKSFAILGEAGGLLDFSRQIDGQQRIRCVGNLANVEGISAVFIHMAKGAQDYKYNCVVPGRLLQHIATGWDRKVKGERICENLSGALENIDLDG
ncbi:hypothetical protein B0J13DRAFT_531575 [Dactylonectria estremocensis]|uniref:Uncharacterized protein n=1 Tax=Dactylonectria estremocensis TaxID=1079267 RepID=A0A9P9DML3_9HYPO|nr:hypothetical protein B0J13DRAFT_531575 [Dactylonectria estremocensis]